MNYYIADLHLGHRAILNLDHRPFFDLQEMESVIVMNWNAAVRPSDTVYVLGDFCWGKPDEWMRILRRLKGNKVLIEGNHDLSNYPAELRKMFADIKPYKEITDDGYNNAGRKVILSHYPILFHKHSNDPNCYMLCGHVHTTNENSYLEAFKRDLKAERIPGYPHQAQIYNVGCMMPWMQYTPRTLDEIVRAHQAQS